MAADRTYWKRVIFPSLLAVVGASVGITVLHCACAVRDGRGLLLAGGSHSGKSTLSLALAQRGFAFLSDDRTYFSQRAGRLAAWGLPTALKVRPDTAAHFPEIGRLEPGIALNGEWAYEFDPEHQLGIHRSKVCEPAWMIFLERQVRRGFKLTRVSSAEAAARLREDLLSEEPEATQHQLETIETLVTRQCWLLRYGGKPQAIAHELAFFCGHA